MKTRITLLVFILSTCFLLNCNIDPGLSDGGGGFLTDFVWWNLPPDKTYDLLENIEISKDTAYQVGDSVLNVQFNFVPKEDVNVVNIHVKFKGLESHTGGFYFLNYFENIDNCFDKMGGWLGGGYVLSAKKGQTYPICLRGWPIPPSRDHKMEIRIFIIKPDTKEYYAIVNGEILGYLKLDEFAIGGSKVKHFSVP